MHLKLLKDIYLVGGQDYHLVYLDWLPSDANVYLLDTGDTLALIDCGCGESLPIILRNVKEAGFDLTDIKHLILTHEHFPHAGAAESAGRMGMEIIASEPAADALEAGDCVRTAAFRYLRKSVPVKAGRVVGDDEIVSIGRCDLRFLMLPGHSAGSMGVLMTAEDRVILFSGDTVLPPLHETRIDSPDYSIADEVESLKRLLDEEPDVILPGHGVPCFQLGRAWIEARLSKLLGRWQSQRMQGGKRDGV